MSLRLLAALATLPALAQPLVDYHQHLFAPAIMTSPGAETIVAADLVRLLDLAGIRRALVLSVAYRGPS